MHPGNLPPVYIQLVPAPSGMISLGLPPAKGIPSFIGGWSEETNSHHCCKAKAKQKQTNRPTFSASQPCVPNFGDLYMVQRPCLLPCTLRTLPTLGKQILCFTKNTKQLNNSHVQRHCTKPKPQPCLWQSPLHHIRPSMFVCNLILKH